MQPLCFDGHFGFLHPADGDCGLVFCGAFAYEQVCAHSGWREFADELAAAGFPVLRFDWRGTGDSLGSDEDPGRVAAWREGLERAIYVLRERTGVRRVGLVGLRLGALLAAEALGRHGDIAALALLAPPASGRAYVREMQALGGVMAAATREPPPASGLAVAGFHMTEETVRDLGGLHIDAPPRACPTLVMSPDGQTGAKRVATAWREAGAPVTIEVFEGYAGFLTDPTFSEMPRAAFATATQWLIDTLQPVATGAITAPAADCVLQGDDFEETATLFGPRDALAGILCRPLQPRENAPVLVFLNAGANPHVGWARATVDHARALAAEGVASFRFDLAGLGDSRPAAGRSHPPIYDDAAVDDVRAAIDWLGDRGFPQVVLTGLCSGAHAAFHAGSADERVVGIVIANLQKFIWRKGDVLLAGGRTAGRSTSAYRRDALRLRTWARMLRGEIATAEIARGLRQRLVQAARKHFGDLAKGLLAGSRPDLVVSGFQALARRGARALVVYSADDAGIDELYLHMGRGGRKLLRLPGADLSLIEGADHNLTSRASREAFRGMLLKFMVETLREAPDAQLSARLGTASGPSSATVSREPAAA